MTILQSASRTHFGPVKFDVARSERPWWQVRYHDGKELAEWETPPETVTKHARPDAKVWRATRWEEVKKKGIIAMRLIGPNGMIGELECNNPEGRFIELKIGGRDVGFAVGGGGVWSKGFATANLIGCVEDDGQVQCWSYERVPHALALRFDTGRCAVCGLAPASCSGRDVTMTTREELVERAPDPAWPERLERSRVTVTDLHIKGPGPWVPLISFRDNVYKMAYFGIGPLYLDVQGLSL